MLEAVLRRQGWILALCLTGIAALAWWYTLEIGARMTTSMGAMATLGAHRMVLGPGEVAITFLMWVVMMVAMMLPAATPAVLLHAAAARRRQDGRRAVRTGLFVLGYLAAWTLFSVVATGLQWLLHDLALLTGAMAIESRPIAALVLIGTGLYQWSPLKYACLRHCQSPLAFFMSHWRDGHAGAARMGFEHGLYCVGCCWLLMLILFLVGVMNLAWVAIIAIYVLAEKVLPVGRRLSQASGVMAIGLGCALLVGI
jgi:predicted metal-binding membrane protein